MKRPQDSDIFGTKSIGYAPRITNDQKVDPNSKFQANMDAQFDSYSRKIGSTHRGAPFAEKGQQTKVNQQAQFDQNYHKYRKEADMQSSIFYEPTIGNSRVTERSRITERIVPKHAYNVADIQYNFGKKQTLQREVKALPENGTNFKGNSSNIFGYDQHSQRNGVKNKVQKLIPHQMQWTDHDSIRHQNFPQSQTTQIQTQRQPKQLNLDIAQSKSTIFKTQQLTKKITEMKIVESTSKQNDIKASNLMKKKQVKPNPEDKTKKQLKKPKQKETVQSEKVQISILKGWNSSIMEDLSKYCRLNSTKILSVNFEQGGKGSLTLDRSKRWQTVTDWMRKDAKLKIRVIN